MEIKTQKLIIKQQIELFEVFTGFECKNKYSIDDESGQQKYFAFEESGGFGRFFLGASRALKLNIIDENKQKLLTIDRPWVFFLAKHTITDGAGKILGYINQRFKIFGSVFELFDANHQLIFKCISKISHPWTFNIFRNDQQKGQILKKWSGFGKEMFTDADKFVVDFGQITDSNYKPLILALAFAIDLRIFERTKR